jgi:hypothetical protein
MYCWCLTQLCCSVATPGLLLQVPTTQQAASTLIASGGAINLFTMLQSRIQTQGLCQGGRSLVARPQQAQPAAARRQAVLARDSSKPNWLKELFDFESWAPKSTKIWRLQQYQPPPAAAEQDNSNSGDASISVQLLSRLCRTEKPQLRVHQYFGLMLILLCLLQGYLAVYAVCICPEHVQTCSCRCSRLDEHSVRPNQPLA